MNTNPTEEALINTEVFQRLRNIKQLALASYVYPGAHHSRFEHCIGAMHLAGQVASLKTLKLGKDRIRIVRLAGLLHDIGHGPFSHVSEQILEKNSLEVAKKYHAENAHELMSILLIQKNSDIHRIVGDDRGEVIKLLQNGKRSIEKDIVSGPLDVDKLDYIRRDSYFAGVNYGVFDLPKVVESITPVPIASDTLTLGISQEGLHAVEQLLLAKYHMNAQIYSHRIRRITDAMLVRGIEIACKEGLNEIREIFNISDSDEFLKHYLKYNDEQLSRTILNRSKGSALQYFQRIRERRLFKEVFCTNIDSSNFSDSVVLRNVTELSNENMSRIAQEAAKLYSNHEDENRIDPEMVIIDKRTISNPTFKPPGVRIDSQTIMVQTRQSRVAFPTVSKIFANSGIDPAENTLSIYLPFDWTGNRDERNKYLSDREAEMKTIVKEIVK